MERKRLGFGWMRLPLTDPHNKATIDAEQAKKLADTFMAQGFTYFDTAYMYHEYQSENSLRECVVERYPRESYVIADKMPMMELKAPEDQVRIFEDQKKKVGVEFFDYYLLHNMNGTGYQTAKNFETIPFLLQKKEAGEIRHLGFSYHDTAELLDQILTEHPYFEFVQLQINYLDWDSEGVQSRKCYEVVRRHGKQVVIMEPVKGGTLANNIPPAVEAMFREAHPDWSIASWAIRFAASLEGVMMVLSGMGSEEMVEDNCRTMGDFAPLTEEDLALVFRARDIINGSITIPCTSCRYCVEGGSCPQNIAIPNYFSLYNLEQQDTNPSWSSQNEYYTNLVKQGYGKASDCIGCGQCEAACPQHIVITEWLPKVADRFEKGIGNWRVRRQD